MAIVTEGAYLPRNYVWGLDCKKPFVTKFNLPKIQVHYNRNETKTIAVKACVHHAGK